jgi:tight adherence protein B
MIGIVLALCAGLGVYYLYTSLVMKWRGLQLGPIEATDDAPKRQIYKDWLVQAGLADVKVSEFAAVMAGLFVLGVIGTFAIFGAPLPSLVMGGFAASFPLASSRSRRQAHRATAQEAWPRMIEEIRILTSSVGRSIPQALFEVGRRGPEELRPAFAAGQREWMISTDFERTIAVLKGQLADPTADAALETLLIAHELGGTDLDRRLEALVEDRILDTQGRKDARAKQSGVRFARRFVLLVPFGMALCGMSIGDGRDSYRTGTGQLLVLFAISMVVACWVWAGTLMHLPEEERVFFE